ncbi:MAG: hypothetical protein ACOC8E_08505 [Planctomycetota bacterium]
MTTLITPQDIIRRIRSNWDSGLSLMTVRDAIAEIVNTPAADVGINTDGDVYDGRRWLSDDELARLIIRLADAGYAAAEDREDASAWLDQA